jgi:hypothetical protein
MDESNESDENAEMVAEIKKARGHSPSRESGKQIAYIFLDISCHGSSSVETNCGTEKNKSLDPQLIEVSISRTKKIPTKKKLVEKISCIVTHPEQTSRSKKICTWTAYICNVPSEYMIYTVNAPCCVGSATPSRGTECMTNGLCDPAEYGVFIGSLSTRNILPKMVKLSRTFDETLEISKRTGFGCDGIINHSLRTNHKLRIPISKMLNKSLQCQLSDNGETYINLNIFLKDGTRKTFCLLNSRPSQYKDIKDETLTSIRKLKDSYPECGPACEEYKKSLQYFENPRGISNCFLNTELSDILQLIYSLVGNYGDNTAIYMTDFSCWITNEYNYETYDALPIVKEVNAKLTTMLTEDNILHGGKRLTRTRRGSLQKRTRKR